MARDEEIGQPCRVNKARKEAISWNFSKPLNGEGGDKR